MNAIKKIKSVFATGLVLLLVSCNSWLEVDPEDRIMDNTLFKAKEGFMTALNGVYSELNKTSLYGRNLTMGMIDVIIIVILQITLMPVIWIIPTRMLLIKLRLIIFGQDCTL